MTKEIDNEYTQEIVCPHCWQEYSDSFEYDENIEIICDSCWKKFSFERIIETTYNTYK